MKGQSQQDSGKRLNTSSDLLVGLYLCLGIRLFLEL